MEWIGEPTQPEYFDPKCILPTRNAGTEDGAETETKVYVTVSKLVLYRFLLSALQTEYGRVDETLCL